MEYNKINNLSGSESENLSKFVTREYVRVNSLSNTYNENKSIRFKTILVNGLNPRDRQNRPLILKNNAEDADDLYIVMLMYKKNYRKTIGSLYNYYRDECSC